MVLHRSLNMWLLPGGHVEPTDRSLDRAARREFREEVGGSSPGLRRCSLWRPGIPIDIDHHPLPANPAKAEPSHSHWDFRFLFRMDDVDFVAQMEEVSAVEWRPVDVLPERLARKLQRVLGKCS